MKKHMLDKQNSQHFEAPRAGLKRQEYSNYETVNGVLRKTTIIRVHYGGGEYNDSVSTEIICHAL